jgi:uncharacterized RmlC-like cupin family protein
MISFANIDRERTNASTKGLKNILSYKHGMSSDEEEHEHVHGTGSFPQLKPPFNDDSISGLMPEMITELERIIKAKKKSKKVARWSELKWRVSAQGVKSAYMIDPRAGFENSLINISATEEFADKPAKGEGHKHTEAYIYIVSGREAIVYDEGTKNEERVECGPGDFMYVPPSVWHKHYVIETPLRKIRILPGPLILNMIAIIASFNLNFDKALTGKDKGIEQPGLKYFDVLGAKKKLEEIVSTTTQ